MTTEIAVIRCHDTRYMKGCGRTLPVYQGANGLEAFCLICGNVFHVNEEKMKWGRPIFAIPRGTVTREV